MAWISELENRGIICLTGPDRQTFLQGLVTNDVYKISEHQSIYTLLLTPQGKYLYDMFITQVGDAWWIEADRSRLQDLAKRLSLYRLKSNIQLDILSDKHIFAIWGGAVPQKFNFEGRAGESRSQELGGCYMDPRLPELGVRVVVDRENLEKFIDCAQFEKTDIESYRYHRYIHGIPETAEDFVIDKSIPLEWGMNELNAIDWHKGCYMGQELTARTRYRGLVRKRLMPCRVHGPVELFSSVEQQGKQIGEWRGLCRDVGLALVRLEALGKPITANGIEVVPLVQNWMQLPTLEENGVN